jgi:hypothetical protein
VVVVANIHLFLFLMALVCVFFGCKLLFVINLHFTDVGLPFRYLLNTYHTWITDLSPETDQEVIPLIDRCFLPEDKPRQVLEEFCKRMHVSHTANLLAIY